MPTRIAEKLSLLFHHRWTAPVLSEIEKSSGSKFVTLVHRLGVSRDSLRHTLDSLIRCGWVRRNPGHGHPLRPEYILTRSGIKPARWCRRVMTLLSRLGVESVVLRKWSMPVAFALRRGNHRFSQIRTCIPGLTPRALAITLKELQSAGLLRRVITEGFPPATRYEFTELGKKLAGVLDQA